VFEIVHASELDHRHGTVRDPTDRRHDLYRVTSQEKAKR